MGRLVRFVFVFVIFLLHLSRVYALETKTDTLMREVIEHYLTIHEKLATDKTEGIEAEAQAIVKKVNEFFMKPCKPDEAACASVMQKISAAASRMKGSDLKTLREVFKDLSLALEKYWKDFNPAWPDVFLYRCPMADDNRGAAWLQKGEAIKNPYFGKSMSTCGEKISK